MQISVQGKNLDIGDALRGHVASNLEDGVAKYFPNPQDASVIVSKDAHLFRFDISVHVGRDIVVHGSGQGNDPYGAFDGALERITKQLRRYKRRLRDHHRNAREDDRLVAQAYVLAADEPEEGEDGVDAHGQPAVIAEMQTVIETLTVGEAVMRMDLGELPVVLFRNRAGGELNVIYRRPDGNIGWIDPRLSRTAPAAS